MWGALTIGSPVPVHAVIPVRLAARRFPNKALFSIDGKPLIAWLIESVQSSGLFDSITVTSEDDSVLGVARSVGVQTCNSSGPFRNGTMRVAAAARMQGLCSGRVVNIQGDMPGIDRAGMATFVCALKLGQSQALTIARPCKDEDERHDKNRVKVVCNEHGEALYFSRGPIPHGGTHSNTLIHVGVYGFAPHALSGYARCGHSELAKSEDLEQLDWLAHGLKLSVVHTPWTGPSLDDPSDLSAVEHWLGEQTETDS